ncbi:heterogeneous nuclear ribonucleoprotein R-like [Oncorhynchus masou masou]|uniref:heterogeneous nuclear ribonucleoprotein R-like n=1 Tax=Oncorhynchus masou masou TaxID=90313 RepID=UPI003182FB08
MAAAEVNDSSALTKEENELMEVVAEGEHTENYQTLIDAGLRQNVAESLDNIFSTGLLAYADLEEGVIDALRALHEEGALSVLSQFKESDLSHVQNKSDFLCAAMKTYRQREKQGSKVQGSKVQESTKGPAESKIKALLERTGYTLDVTTEQRKYGGPPPEEVFKGAQPGIGTEVFVGKIPRDLYEDELVPLFEKAGPIWDLRLMMDPLSGQNRGYAFITFCGKDAATEAVKLCDNYEIRSRKYLGVCKSVANNRLFVGSIPKNKTRENILEDFSKVTEGLQEVILYPQTDDKEKNRGFCFLEYEDHKSAAEARLCLMSDTVMVWGNPVTVEWANPVTERNAGALAQQVKVLFVRKLAASVTEELLEKTFSAFGKVDRLNKIEDYAFVHFEDKDAAVKAMAEMNGKELGGGEIEIRMAKRKKARNAQRQATRNRRNDADYNHPPPRIPPPDRVRGRGGGDYAAYPPDYNSYDDYYGFDYHDPRRGYEDPHYGYEDPRRGYEDPHYGYEDPHYGYEDPHYGYEDPHYGYEDFYSMRGHGRLPSRDSLPPPRDRRPPPTQGYVQRGPPIGGPRDGRVRARGGPFQPQRGRGNRKARGNHGGGKRKADVFNQPDSKRRQTN